MSGSILHFQLHLRLPMLQMHAETVAVEVVSAFSGHHRVPVRELAETDGAGQLGRPLAVQKLLHHLNKLDN